MTIIAAIGEPDRVAGFAFAGVEVRTAEDAAAARAAWRALDGGVAVLILTPSAHAALVGELDRSAGPLCVVMP